MHGKSRSLQHEEALGFREALGFEKCGAREGGWGSRDGEGGDATCMGREDEEGQGERKGCGAKGPNNGIRRRGA